jgi:hypothetical protein
LQDRRSCINIQILHYVEKKDRKQLLAF